jgi:hypothetical protein
MFGWGKKRTQEKGSEVKLESDGQQHNRGERSRGFFLQYITEPRDTATEPPNYTAASSCHVLPRRKQNTRSPLSNMYTTTCIIGAGFIHSGTSVRTTHPNAPPSRSHIQHEDLLSKLTPHCLFFWLGYVSPKPCFLSLGEKKNKTELAQCTCFILLLWDWTQLDPRHQF